MNVDDLRRLPRRWPGVTFDQWLQGLNDLQLVEYAAGRLVDIRRLHDELGACRDCFHEAVWLLREAGPHTSPARSSAAGSSSGSPTHASRQTTRRSSS